MIMFSGYCICSLATTSVWHEIQKTAWI